MYHFSRRKAGPFIHGHRGRHATENMMIRPMIFAPLLLCTFLWAQSATPSTDAKANPSSASPAQAGAPATTAAKSRFRPDRFAGRAGEYYRLIWGVDSLSVKWTESGEVIRFSYRVLDAEKASTLNDKKNEPSLIDPAARVKLVVPSLEKVGQLRQTASPQAGKVYWMAFSNKGRRVKRGDRVDVVIGNFRAQGLTVD
jgi:hypothetical protein